MILVVVITGVESEERAIITLSEFEMLLCLFKKSPIKIDLIKNNMSRLKYNLIIRLMYIQVLILPMQGLNMYSGIATIICLQKLFNTNITLLQCALTL